MKTLMILSVAGFIALSANAAQAQTVCGTIEVQNVGGMAAVMPAIILHVRVPNLGQGGGGGTAIDFILDDDQGGEILQSLKRMNRRTVCVIGNEITAEGDDFRTFSVEKIKN